MSEVHFELDGVQGSFEAFHPQMMHTYRTTVAKAAKSLDAKLAQHVTDMTLLKIRILKGTSGDGIVYDLDFTAQDTSRVREELSKIVNNRTEFNQKLVSVLSNFALGVYDDIVGPNMQPVQGFKLIGFDNVAPLNPSFQ